MSSSVEFLTSGSDVYTSLVLDIGDSDVSVYDVEVGQTVTVQAGRDYKASLWAFSVPPNAPVSALVKVGSSTGPAFTTYFQQAFTIPGQVSATEYGASFEWTFTASATDNNAWFGVFLGGTNGQVKLDSLYLLEQGTNIATGVAVYANQVGFLPGGAKRATVLTTQTTPLDWTLVDATGASVLTGKTTAFGSDPASGDAVQLVDFSAFAGTGSGYKLKLAGGESEPFSVKPDVYASLRADALRFYYQQRCSSAIVEPYAGGDAWVRAAGHPDTSVSCLPGSGCTYALDVSKGWYDAGDHGKYVVNGGIALFTLLDLYERTKYLGTTLGQLGDGSLNIPESANGAPDLLDEARWEMEFMLGMQVPEGQPLAGMAHHKVHDDAWTPIPTIPADDQHAAPPASTEHRRDAQPGRDRRSSCARLSRHRRRVRHQVRRCGRARFRGGAGQPRRLRPEHFGRRRHVRRRGRIGRALLGGRGALPHHGQGVLRERDARLSPLCLTRQHGRPLLLVLRCRARHRLARGGAERAARVGYRQSARRHRRRRGRGISFAWLRAATPRPLQRTRGARTPMCSMKASSSRSRTTSRVTPATSRERSPPWTTCSAATP